MTNFLPLRLVFEALERAGLHVVVVVLRAAVVSFEGTKVTLIYFAIEGSFGKELGMIILHPTTLPKELLFLAEK